MIHQVFLEKQGRNENDGAVKRDEQRIEFIQAIDEQIRHTHIWNEYQECNGQISSEFGSVPAVDHEQNQHQLSYHEHVSQKVKGFAIEGNEVKGKVEQECNQAQHHQVIEVFYHVSTLQQNEKKGQQRQVR